MAAGRPTVDAAINLAGPWTRPSEPDNLQRRMFGIAYLGGNAYGFTAPITPAQQVAATRPFIRRRLLD